MQIAGGHVALPTVLLLCLARENPCSPPLSSSEEECAESDERAIARQRATCVVVVVRVLRRLLGAAGGGEGKTAGLNRECRENREEERKGKAGSLLGVREIKTPTPPHLARSLRTAWRRTSMLTARLTTQVVAASAQAAAMK